MTVDYVSKWVEAIALPTNDTKPIVIFLIKKYLHRLERWSVTMDLISVELEEFRFMAYENTKMYKERSRLQHDVKIRKREFLKSRCIGPYTINQLTPYGTIEFIGKGGQPFLVNGQRVKHYFRVTINTVVDEKPLQCSALWDFQRINGKSTNTKSDNKEGDQSSDFTTKRNMVGIS
ncbi:protein NYNRIN-like [Gossypium australe]|uniref:Protein NYNRIN-like n=1 Tax=Gossypium australe TaxID=47621 RepID=A0A5B6VY44_9ROSI|nr:protein NYNRIN-like [Gossypium australe]